MDKYDYLKLMIENRDVWNDDTVEVYFDAHEEYFNIVDYEEEHKIPDKKEIKMLIDSLYNIDIYGYLRDTLVDRIYGFMEVSEDNFDYALKCILENFDGYYVMMRLFYFLDNKSKIYRIKIIDRVIELETERKFYMMKWMDEDKTVFSDEFMNVIRVDKPKYISNFLKIKYECTFLPPYVNIKLSERDKFIISLLQGYRLYINDDINLYVFWDDLRKKNS